MLNLNSVFSEGLKYNIKWHIPLTKSSVGEAPSMFGCEGNNVVVRGWEVGVAWGTEPLLIWQV